MTRRQEKLKKYIYDITRGLVSLKDVHLQTIEDIVNDKDEFFEAKLYVKNYQIGSYEHQRTSKVYKDAVHNAIAKYGGKSVEGFYRWDIYDPQGKFIKSLYTVKTNIF